MDENDVCLQEYECGEKADVYRMNKHQYHIDLSALNKKPNRSLSSLFRDIFYPDNYPLGN